MRIRAYSDRKVQDVEVPFQVGSGEAQKCIGWGQVLDPMAQAAELEFRTPQLEHGVAIRKLRVILLYRTRN